VSVIVGVSVDNSAARTRHPDAVAIEAGVKLAVAAVLLEEGVKGVEERHARECSVIRRPSALTCGHASALQRVWSITRRARLMRSQGSQRRASDSFIAISRVSGPATRATRNVHGQGLVRPPHLYL
jgi:hypothetical protein